VVSSARRCRQDDGAGALLSLAGVRLGGGVPFQLPSVPARRQPVPAR